MGDDEEQSQKEYAQSMKNECEAFEISYRPKGHLRPVPDAPRGSIEGASRKADFMIKDGLKKLRNSKKRNEYQQTKTYEVGGVSVSLTYDSRKIENIDLKLKVENEDSVCKLEEILKK